MEIEILHAARGDKKKKIDTDTPAGKKELAALLDKLLKGGTAIFLERKKRTLRVKKYDAETDTLTVEVEQRGVNKEVKTRAGRAKATAVAPVAGGSDSAKCPQCGKPIEKPISRKIIRQGWNPRTQRKGVIEETLTFCSADCGGYYQMGCEG